MHDSSLAECSTCNILLLQLGDHPPPSPRLGGASSRPSLECRIRKRRSERLSTVMPSPWMFLSSLCTSEEPEEEVVVSS